MALYTLIKFRGVGKLGHPLASPTFQRCLISVLHATRASHVFGIQKEVTQSKDVMFNDSIRVDLMECTVLLVTHRRHQ